MMEVDECLEVEDDLLLPEIDEDLDLDDDLPEEDVIVNTSSRLLRKQSVQSKKTCAKDERNAAIKKVAIILQKSENERTEDDANVLDTNKEVIKEVKSRWKKRDEAKRRVEEFEEPLDELREKCHILAQAIAQSQHLVVYTGAGISTAARIPDYRGTNGIWTRLQQGKDIGNHDLSLAEPTYTHMALHELYKQNILKYVVSQNCDGLHLRSGLPKTAISEVHGNMYVEVCKTCKPQREYWRFFDVTENTARYSHKTMRLCYICNGELSDTIVHFGERGSLQWPLNWSGASKNARKATTILCLGSSLKVLKKYPWLWQMHKPVKRRPNLYIVNLQWTPKDDCANVKIHGKCDLIMKMVMEYLGIQVPQYERNKDPIFIHGTHLHKYEVHTTTQPFLKWTDECEHKPTIKQNNKETNKCDTPLINNASNIIANLPKITLNINPFSIDNILHSTNNKINTIKDENKTQNNTLQPSNNIEQCRKLHDNATLQHTSPQTINPPDLITNKIIQPDAIIKNATQNLFNENYQALLTYYQISNSILRNQFAFTPELVNYPFQTSLLYSGLHSIINPPTFIQDNYLNQFVVSNNPVIKVEVKEEIIAPTCEFCFDNYKSNVCVFYDKFEPVFMKQRKRLSKIDNVEKALFCTCCDFSTEEELSDDDVSPDKICKVDDDSALISSNTSKIQPGWFGKGYRKHKKYKKKVTTY